MPPTTPVLVRRLRRLGDEAIRIGAAKATHQILLRRGRQFPMFLGCGYPKSGTVWLCRLLSTYLAAPYPQNYSLPIAMRSVIHGHWDYDARLPSTAYIRRDGRDVMVSMYFHNMRQLKQQTNVRQAAELRRTYARTFGRSFDPDDVRANLPRFIELEAADPTGAHVTWARHIEDWAERTGVGYVTYEGLLQAPTASLGSLMEQLGEGPVDPDLVDIAVRRHDFARVAKRRPGAEDRASFQRKGIAGDWENHFTREAGERFDAIAGDALVHTGYAPDRGWFRDLPVR